jgi:hypothetical protein
MRLFGKTAAAGLLLALLSATVWADTDGHDESVAEVLGEIRESLGLGSEATIDPDEVPPELLERLGDAVMAETHPDPEQHEWMDRMMGGEGSESLTSAHRWMGYRYLSGGYGTFGMGGHVMGGMHGSARGNWGMMGNPDFSAANPYESPEETLKRRYAEGEISRREYRRMLRDIRESP